jgi:hypothetical protein
LVFFSVLGPCQTPTCQIEWDAVWDFKLHDDFVKEDL